MGDCHVNECEVDVGKEPILKYVHTQPRSQAHLIKWLVHIECEFLAVTFSFDHVNISGALKCTVMHQLECYFWL